MTVGKAFKADFLHLYKLPSINYLVTFFPTLITVFSVILVKKILCHYVLVVLCVVVKLGIESSSSFNEWRHSIVT